MRVEVSGRDAYSLSETVPIAQFTNALPVLVVFWSSPPRDRHLFIAVLPNDVEAGKLWVDEWFKKHSAMAKTGDALALVRTYPGSETKYTVYDRIL